MLLAWLWALVAMALPWAGAESSMKVHALRLQPGQDLKLELQNYQREQHLQSAWVMTCVGSLQHLRLRLADRSDPSVFDGPYEIVSLVGTLGPDGAHLHLCASDRDGRTVGGHLLEGNPVYTTAEVVLGEGLDMRFRRLPDAATGSLELRVEPLGNPGR